MPYGRYILSEISAPGGYEKAGEISVGIVSPGETREYAIVNSRIPDVYKRQRLTVPRIWLFTEMLRRYPLSCRFP